MNRYNFITKLRFMESDIIVTELLPFFDQCKFFSSKVSQQLGRPKIEILHQIRPTSSSRHKFKLPK